MPIVRSPKANRSWVRWVRQRAVPKPLHGSNKMAQDPVANIPNKAMWTWNHTITSIGGWGGGGGKAWAGAGGWALFRDRRAHLRNPTPWERQDSLLLWNWECVGVLFAAREGCSPTPSGQGQVSRCGLGLWPPLSPTTTLFLSPSNFINLKVIAQSCCSTSAYAPLSFF